MMECVLEEEEEEEEEEAVQSHNVMGIKRSERTLRLTTEATENETGKEKN